MSSFKTKFILIAMIISSVFIIHSFTASTLVPVQAGTGAISAGSASGDRGDTVSIAIKLVNGSAVGAFGADISWDASKFSFVGISKGSKVPGSWTFLSNPSGSSVRIGGYGTPDISGSGTLATLRLKISAGAAYGSTPISVAGVTDGLSKGSNGSVNIQESVNIVTFKAMPETIAQGETTTLSWTIERATSANINPGVGGITPTSGTKKVSPTETTTYTLTAQGPGGPKRKQVTVKVSDVPKPVINSFKVSPSTVVQGDKVTFSWDITGANSASIDNGVGNVNSKSGTATAKPKANTTYTLTATNPGGSVTATVNVKIIKEPIIHVFSSSSTSKKPIYKGSRAQLVWSVTGAEKVSINKGVGNVDNESGVESVKPDSDTEYTLTATNGAGSSTAKTTVYVTNKPVIREFSATPENILENQASNLRWAVSGANDVTISPSVGSVSPSRGSRGVMPNSSTTYTLKASNGSGTTTGTVRITMSKQAPDLEMTFDRIRKRGAIQWPASDYSLLGSGNVGEPVDIVLNLHNVGNGDAAGFNVIMKENGLEVNSRYVDGLNNGKSTSVSFTYVPLFEGENNLEFIADPEFAVPEFDKGNNILSGTFNAEAVKGPDLVISDVNVTSPIDNVLLVTFKITNVGSDDSGEFNYHADLRKKEGTFKAKKDTLVVEGSISNLRGGGESVEVTKTVVVKKVQKKFYFYGIIDINNTVSEENEDNNLETVLIYRDDL